MPVRVRWGRHLRPEDRREVDRLMEMADEAQIDRRHYNMMFDVEGVRRCQLYHTLPHEVGHWADLYDKVELPSLHDDFDRWEERWDRYFQRPAVEREEYAHRYAVEAMQRLREQGLVPFARKIDVGALQAEGLRPEDFLRQ